MPWTIHPVEKFYEFLEPWQRLNSVCGDSALLHPDFYSPVIEEFSSGDELLAIHERAGGPDAMGIFTRTNKFGWQTFQPAVAPLGGWVRDPKMPLKPLLSGLIRAMPGFGVHTSITQQDPDLMARPTELDGIRTLEYIPTARMNISGSFEDYWKGRSKNLRHAIKRQRNRLSRENIECRVELKTEPGDVAGAVSDYARIESAGWKGEAGTAVAENDRQSRFYTAMLRNFCRRGDGLIFRCWYNDRLVATDLCIHHNGVVIILKTTYDESEKATSPAQLMRQEAFKKFFDEGKVHTVEFYGCIMDWHMKLTDDHRTMYHINYYRWPFVGWLHGLSRRGGTQAFDGALGRAPRKAATPLGRA